MADVPWFYVPIRHKLRQRGDEQGILVATEHDLSFIPLAEYYFPLDPFRTTWERERIQGFARTPPSSPSEWLIYRSGPIRLLLWAEEPVTFLVYGAPRAIESLEKALSLADSPRDQGE